MPPSAAGPSHPFPEQAIAVALGRQLDRPVTIAARRGLGGGCIHAACRLDTSAGPFFAKAHEAPPPGIFGAEAAGLRALAGAGSGLVVPEPVVWSDGDGDGDSGGPAFLVTEWIESGPRRADFDTELGRGLAALHRATAQRFGFERDGYCGLTPQPNGWMSAWADFYRERRLEPQVRSAVDGRRLDTAGRRVLYRLLERLDALVAGTEEPPALIHGDLWGGNLLAAADGRPALVDPAAYYGHREAELGMMTLFGGFGTGVYAAYEEARPLLPEWRERNGLYRLYHLLNHVNIFGETYVELALAAARRYL
jgi:fructosamine-3-kinase